MPVFLRALLYFFARVCARVRVSSFLGAFVMADFIEDRTPAAEGGEGAEVTAAPADEVLSLPEESEAAPADDGSPEAKPPKARFTRKTVFFNLFDLLETFSYALVIMMVVFVFVLRVVTVDGTSMENTLHHQDRLVLSDMFFTPSTGDIVVIDTDGVNGLSEKFIIKRVIAVGGQHVEIDYTYWTVKVDGVVLNEDYIKHSPGLMNKGNFDGAEEVVTHPDGSQSFTVPEGTVFVMGDNRNGSTDSRMVGFLEEERILGRVLLRLFPWDVFGRVK